MSQPISFSMTQIPPSAPMLSHALWKPEKAVLDLDLFTICLLCVTCEEDRVNKQNSKVHLSRQGGLKNFSQAHVWSCIVCVAFNDVH